MASERGKWSNYVHSCISGTHWLDAATPLQARTKPMIPRQCWQPLRNKTDRRISCWMVQILLDRITFGFSLSILWGGGGGTPAFKWLGWLKDFLGVEIFDSGIFLVSVSFTWGFFAYSKQFEVVILMLLMKQKMFLGVPSVVWVLLETLGIFCFGGGGWFCPHSRNGVTMCAVAYRVLTEWRWHHFGRVRSHWFLDSVDSPWEMKQNVRISRTVDSRLLEPSREGA